MLHKNELIEYYDVMASAYDENAGYYDPEGEKLREPIKAHHRQLFKGRRVLEIACGSGYWTEVIGEVAASVLATDINTSMLELARKRCSRLPSVRFQQADAYSMEGVSGEFDAAFANCWWSHMPTRLITKFLAALHRKLKSDSIVLFVDQLPADSGFSARNARGLKIADGNRLELRLASDGRTYGVIKNYSTGRELQQLLAGVARDVVYQEEQGVWSVMYKLR